MIEATNPGNIRYYSGCIGNNRGFCIFPSFEAGVYQVYRQLLIYYTRDKLRTITAILNKYAPPSENNTNAYISFLSKYSGLPANKILSENELILLIPGILKMESGTIISFEQVQKIISEANPIIDFDRSNLALLIPLFLFAVVWLRK